jgi:hypothetical protein
LLYQVNSSDGRALFPVDEEIQVVSSIPLSYIFLV